MSTSNDFDFQATMGNIEDALKDWCDADPVKEIGAHIKFWGNCLVLVHQISRGLVPTSFDFQPRGEG